MTQPPAPLTIVRAQAHPPEVEVEIQHVSWSADGAYVRFQEPRGRRVAYVPLEAIDATRAGRITAAGAVAIDGGPPLGEIAQILADELAFAPPTRRRSQPSSLAPVDTLEPAPRRRPPTAPSGRGDRRSDWVVVPALLLLAGASTGALYLMFLIAGA